MKKKTSTKKKTVARPCVIERNGERHSGHYLVERGMITVYYSKGGQKRTQFGGMDAEGLAASLLTELVRESRA